MSGTRRVSSVHLSGATLSYLLAAACATEPATKYLFTLYGHHDTRAEATDVSDSIDVCDVVVVGVVPVSATFRGQADPVGLLSISKSPFHKLSFQDTACLAGNSGVAISKPGRETDPTIFILMTEDPNSGRTAGTLKVEFTAYQVSPRTGEAARVIPMRTDNFLDSLKGLTTIADTFCRNPSVLHLAKSHKSSAGEKCTALQTAVDRIQSDSEEKRVLIKRIEELHKAIEAKKATVVK